MTRKTKRAAVEFAMTWQGPYALHKDRYYFPRVNFWRDIFPGKIGEGLEETAEGKEKTEQFHPGQLVTPYSAGQILSLGKNQIRLPSGKQADQFLRLGRFYPRGIIIHPNIDSEDTRPARYLGKEGDLFLLDLNHPLAKHPIELSAKIIKHLEPKDEWGGVCNEMAYELTEDGPGLQASLIDRETDFFSESPFKRDDESPDPAFYKTDRFVNHLDEEARQAITEIYARFLKPGMRVLDLMSSFNSHLPQEVKNLSVTGLGLNREEMEKNEQLQDSITHDLNSGTGLPFQDSEFDAALCTVSVEYLIEPTAVLQEIARILKPGAPFVVTFSNRWFPPKVITLWSELNMFERAGFVLECFRKSGSFKNLHSESIRGLPRPTDDKYFPEFRKSDPIFAVWGDVS